MGASMKHGHVMAAAGKALNRLTANKQRPSDRTYPHTGIIRHDPVVAGLSYARHPDRRRMLRL
jgi:hypothetical protein